MENTKHFYEYHAISQTSLLVSTFTRRVIVHKSVITKKFIRKMFILLIFKYYLKHVICQLLFI